MKLVESTEERDLRGVLRTLFGTHCSTEVVRRVTAGGPVPDALWQELTKVGIFDLAVHDVDLDGVGSSVDALGLVAEEAGRALCPDVVLSTVLAGLALSCVAGSTPERAAGGPTMRTGDVDRVAAGGLRVAAALWDPADASRLAPVLRAEPTADGWVLSGELDHVWGAVQADVVLVTARSIGGAEPAETLITTVPLTDVQREQRAAMGGAVTRLRFDRVPVAADDVWQVDHQQLRWLAQVAVALQAREIAGGCQAVLERTVDYVANREQFGRAIGTFQAVQHHIADMHIATAATRLAAARAIFWLGRGNLATHAVATATMKSSDAYPFVTLTAHQLHGGMGYVREADLHLWSERAAVLRARWGTSDVAAEWLANEVTGG